MAHFDYLPVNFESLEKVRKQRTTVLNTIKKLPSGINERIPFSAVCNDAHPCKSGLCPVCHRTFREVSLKCMDEQNLSELLWYHSIIVIKNWLLEPEDDRLFGDLKSNRAVKQLVQLLQRRAKKLNKHTLLIFGSVETAYDIIGDEHVGKGFHVHMMISGLARLDIADCIKRSGLLCDKAYNPLVIKRVKRTKEDFVRAASYAIKQPFRQTTREFADSKPRHKFPTVPILGELIANYGAHPIGGRTFYTGFNFRNNRFELNEKVKSRVVSKIKRIRKLASEN